MQLNRGHLRGLIGVLAKIANQHRMYVSVTLLKRSISVEAAPEWIQPVEEAAAAAEPAQGVAGAQTESVFAASKNETQI